jgi:hypothetical protein
MNWLLSFERGKRGTMSEKMKDERVRLTGHTSGAG